MKVKLMLDKRQYKEKPASSEIGGILYRMKQTEIEIQDLAIGLSNGMTCKPALLNGTKSTDWLQQQVFMLDFDHNTTISKELQVCKDLNITPTFLYTSFRHNIPELNYEDRFRMVFITDEVITDGDKRDKLQATLMGVFGNIDKVCFNRDRNFFGGKAGQPIFTNYEARLNPDDFINKYFKEEYTDYISSTVKKKKTKAKNDEKNQPKKQHISDDYLQNIDAIKSLNPSKLRGLVHELKRVTDKEDNLLLVTPFSGVVTHSRKELFECIYSIDLSDFIGIDENEFINCILPDHEDNDPSAHIYTTKDGTQVYHCFGCEKSFTIIGLVEVLAKTTRRRAIDFIKKVYNIKLIESEWIIEQREILSENIFYLDTEEFKIQFPNLSKLIRYRKLHLQALNTYFSALISEDLKLDDKPLFFASYPKLLEVCSINKNRKIVLSQSLILFNLLNLIDKIEPDKLPIEQLNKAKHISAKHGFKKLTNFYQFGEYGYLLFEQSEEIAKELIKNNVSIKGISREYVLRTFGHDIADKVFPQFKYENHRGNGNSKKSNDLTMKISKSLLKVIEKQGYIMESKIKINDKVETQWKKSIQEILDTYDLVRVKASKANKEKYNLPDKIPYQSFVICKNI